MVSSGTKRAAYLGCLFLCCEGCIIDVRLESRQRQITAVPNHNPTE